MLIKVAERRDEIAHRPQGVGVVLAQHAAVARQGVLVEIARGPVVACGVWSEGGVVGGAEGGGWFFTGPPGPCTSRAGLLSGVVASR